MVIDFSFILVAAMFVTGIIWAAYAWGIQPHRVRAAQAAGGTAGEAAGGALPREPVIVEYSRSFFPIIVIVLVVRSFLFEPFRIPSDSMMPTLLDGDFIFVSKFSYGLRLPVLNSKVVAVGDPRRGDVVVFRLPSDPSINYIKRLVGLPGDHLVVRDNHIYINGEAMPVHEDGPYRDEFRFVDAEEEDEYGDAQLGTERLGEKEHRVMFMPDRLPTDYDTVVPAGHYFFMGDNRDNSRDSRYPEVGFVPEDHLVGKAVRIWLNFKFSAAPQWGRMGDAIE